MRYFIKNRNKTRFFFLAILAALFPARSIAQEAQGTKRADNIPYTFSSEQTIFTYLNGGNIVPNISTSSTTATNKLPLGFSFQFGCETYTDFYAGSNGTLSFNTPFTTHNNSSSSLTPANLTLLAPLWDDFGVGTGTFSYNTTGTAPNQVFTAEWKNWKWSKNATSGTITFQIKLYEGSNTIEYIYNQEPNNSDSGTKSASIGLFNGITSNADAKQLWLNTSSASPTASTTFVGTINTHPGHGQLYRFTRKGNNDSCKIVYYGQTIINQNGGTNANDGLRITLSGAANMQVRKKDSNQIYSSSVNLQRGTSYPYDVPGSSHGIVFSVGQSNFTGGTLSVGSNPENSNKLKIISSTQQSFIESSPGHFVNEIKLSALKNELTYFLTIKYIYSLPENFFTIEYNVIIPNGNSEQIKLSHGWDTYLQGSDKGPGFVSGKAPNLVVGVVRGSSYEAFEYLGGVPWSGYFSGYYSDMNKDLGSTMTFKNTIYSSSDTDNGIGISINFGSAPGNFTSSNKLVFGCEAGDTAPVLINKGSICKGMVLDLNSLITSPTPAGTVLVWKDAKGAVVTDPTTVTTAGTYTAYYHSAKYNCSSPSSSTVITNDNTCGICYKPGVVTGKEAGSLTIISTLNRENNPGLNKRNGALILESTEKGFAISKVNSPETAIAVPVAGMLVYDPKSNCLKLYNGSSWNCIQQSCIDN
ncbi:hypothetical protein [Flavobacterium poyangense]|uniref:hypothetical protein n=1 Tax=Flavobacterium poyangense TaxID=2204302 RepID=UPI0014237558|nr:hypothetical protein [Flavobacterium sp. JXAS1]